MSLDYRPSPIPAFVLDIVEEFRSHVQAVNVAAASSSNPDRFLYERIVNGRDLAMWNERLEEFDRILKSQLRRTA